MEKDEFIRMLENKRYLQLRRMYDMLNSRLNIVSKRMGYLKAIGEDNIIEGNLNEF